MIPEVGCIYSVEFELTAWNVLEDDIFGIEPQLSEPYKTKEKWNFARILMRDTNGDLIVEHDTGIKNTYPRIDRVAAKYINEYRWIKIEVPETYND